MFNRATSEISKPIATKRNNNYATAQSSSNNSLYYEDPIGREKPLLELINEYPMQCSIQWPLKTKAASGTSKTYQNWSQFCSSTSITIKCDLNRLIQILSPPLIFYPEDSYLFTQARHYWDTFSTSGTRSGNFVSVQCHDTNQVPSLALSSESSLHTFSCSWQRKLLFMLVCLFADDDLRHLTPITSSRPLITGNFFSLLSVLRVQGTSSHSFCLQPSGSRLSRAQMLGYMVHYWDLEFRTNCGMLVPDSDYPLQEKFFFLLMAYNVIMQMQKHYSPLLLGLLRMMFAVQHDGSNMFEHRMEKIRWSKSILYNIEQTRKELEPIYQCAKVINRLIEKNDTQVTWLADNKKKEDFVRMALDLVPLIPLQSQTSYPMLSNGIGVHTTRYFQESQIKDKLFWVCDLELLAQMEYHKGEYKRDDWVYLVVEDQIALNVKKYFESLEVNNALVADVYDPETSRYVVFVMISNSCLFKMQALGWAQVAHKGRLIKELYQASGMAPLFLFANFNKPLERVKYMIMMCKSLLLGDYSHKSEEITEHAKKVLVFFSYLYSPPKPENKTGVIPYLFKTPGALVADCIRYHKAVNDICRLTACLISLLIYPWLKRVVIHTSTLEFLRDLLLQSTPTTPDKSKAAASQANLERVGKCKYELPALFCQDEHPEHYLDAKDSLPGITEVMEFLIKNRSTVGSSTAIAVFSCITPVLPVNSSFFAFLFRSSTGSLLNDCTKRTEKHLLRLPTPMISMDVESKMVECAIYDLFRIEQERRVIHTLQGVPKLNVDGIGLKDLCLPLYAHNGECVNPLFTSFLESVPARQHKESSKTALQDLLNTKNKRQRVLATPVITVPPSSPVYNPQSPIEMKEGASPPYIPNSPNVNNMPEIYSPSHPSMDTSGTGSAHNRNQYNNDYDSFQQTMSDST